VQLCLSLVLRHQALVARQLRAVSQAEERLGGVYRALGAWTVEQAAENAAAGDLELTPAEIAWLNLQRDDR